MKTKERKKAVVVAKLSAVAGKLPVLRPAFKCHGGKAYLKNWIIDKFPKDYDEMVYVEPFAGAASVLFNKKPGPEEVLNDLHPGIIEIFRAIRDQPNDFVKKLRKLSYSNDCFTKALERAEEPFPVKLDLAVNEYTLRRMSRGGLKKAFAWSDRLRGGQPGDVNAWETALDQIPELSARLQSVYIFCKTGVEVIRAFNKANTLLYVDPPYLHTTRSTKNAYDYEMVEDEHKKLCDLLCCFRGKVIISGYDSELYNLYFADWKKLTRDIVNHSSQGKTKELKTEIIWKNF